MFANKIDIYTSANDDKLKSHSNQNFDFEGEGFSSMLEKDEEVSGKLRETETELLEDEAILSSDEENKAIAKRNTENKIKYQQEQTQQIQNKQTADERNLLKLMELSTQTNMGSIKINKRKKENPGDAAITSSNEELESLLTELSNYSPSEELETLIDMNFNKEKTDKKKQNDQELHETQEEILEDLSILSTDEENLAMARKSQEYTPLNDSDFSNNKEADIELLSEITSIQNQSNITAPHSREDVTNAESVLAKIIQESKKNITRISIKDMEEKDVEYIIQLLQNNSGENNFEEENPYGLSAKFITALKDAILNKKIFRIDFDNEISVIIKIDVEGKISANFITSNKETEEKLKDNLYILQERFEKEHIKYDKLEYTSTENTDVLDINKIEEIINTNINNTTDKITH